MVMSELWTSLYITFLHHILKKWIDMFFNYLHRLCLQVDCKCDEMCDVCVELKL